MTPEELAELDLVVAKAEGYNFAEIVTEPQRYGRDEPFVVVNGALVSPTKCITFSPTRDGAEALRLLEKYRLTLWHSGSGWSSWVSFRPRAIAPCGPTPAIAICRAVVALAETAP